MNIEGRTISIAEPAANMRAQNSHSVHPADASQTMLMFECQKCNAMQERIIERVGQGHGS